MIVGRIDTVLSLGYRPLGRTTLLIVECPFCRKEYNVAPARPVSMVSRAAMCPDCRNDSGRRERMTDARYHEPSTFNTTPRMVAEGSDVYRPTTPKKERACLPTSSDIIPA